MVQIKDNINKLVMKNLIHFSFYFDGIMYYNLHQYIGEDEYGIPCYNKYQFPVALSSEGGDFFGSDAPAVNYMKEIRAALNEGTFTKIDIGLPKKNYKSLLGATI